VLGLQSLATALGPRRDMAFDPIPGMPGHQMGGGRWYPTLFTLGDGSVIAFAGHPRHEHVPHQHDNPEIYSAGKDDWAMFRRQRPWDGLR
jgi:hypothetical protein